MSAPAPVGRRGASRAALRGLAANRDYRLLWLGGAVSQTGTSLTFLAYPLLALVLTGSAFDAGLVSAVGFAARLVGQLPAGYLADVVDRRRLLIGADGTHAVLLSATAAMAVTGWFSTSALLALTAAGSLTSGLAGPSRTQAFRAIVDRTHLAEATALSTGRGYAIDLAAPAAGGALFTLHRALPFALDALSYVFSAVCTARIRTPLGPDRDGPRPRFVPAFARGWTLLWTDRFLRASSLYSAGTNLLVSSLLFLVVLGGGTGSTTALVAGSAITAAAAAGLAGASIAPFVQRRVPLHLVLSGTAVVRGLAVLSAFVADAPLLRVVGLMVVMFTSPIAAAALSTARILVVDPEVLGRVDGATSVIAGVTQPLAPLLAGFLVHRYGTAAACGVLGVGFVVLAALVLRERALRIWSSA